MARRIFEEEDAWTEEASHAANDISVALADILALLEADGPVDIRDFHYLASSTLGTFVADLAIRRRLGDPASPPDPIVRAYPRLSQNIREVTPKLEEGWEDWLLEIVDK
jgi:hypothetical protein